MKRLDASVCGHVQGVSYRYYASREAKRLKLTGWVRNERDGSVTVVAEGKEESSVASKLSDREQEFATFDIRWA